MNRPMLYALIVSSLSILIFGYLIFRFTVHLDPQNLTAAEAAVNPSGKDMDVSNATPSLATVATQLRN